MNKITPIIASTLWILAATFIQAAEINVFLDDGSHVPGSSNTGVPFDEGARDSSWDVAASAENGLADIGAAVMSVRMVTFNINGNSRGAATTSGNGLAVLTGANNNWMDANSREGALFQLTFYADAAKTTELKGLDIYFKSVTSRVELGLTNLQLMDIFSGSGALAIMGSGDSATVSVGGTTLVAAGEPAADQILRGLFPSSDAVDYYTMSATNGFGRQISFTENDSFWIRRRNDTSSNNAYQVGKITFEVVPRPLRASEINVFLDDGLHVSGSSNTNIPFSELDRDATWDVSSSEESGLTNFGAAVMSVRMVTFDGNGNSRAAATTSGNGLGVYAATNNWMDGSLREGAVFQLTFYEDTAKTMEIKDLDIIFKSLVSRSSLGNISNQLVDVFSGSGVLDVSGTNDAATVSVGGTMLAAGNDVGMASGGFLQGLKPWSDPLDYYTMVDLDGSVQFSENDSFWVRRRNDPLGEEDQAYQLGGITFFVVPGIKPVTLSISPVDASSFEVSWTGQSFATYSLQATDNLQWSGWSNLLSGIDGISGGMAVTTTSSTVEAFYRVQAQ